MPNNFEVKLGMVGGKMPLAILAQESQGGFEFSHKPPTHWDMRCGKATMKQPKSWWMKPGLQTAANATKEKEAFPLWCMVFTTKLLCFFISNGDFCCPDFAVQLAVWIRPSGQLVAFPNVNCRPLDAGSLQVRPGPSVLVTQLSEDTAYFFRARELCSNGAPLGSPWGNTEEIGQSWWIWAASSFWSSKIPPQIQTEKPWCKKRKFLWL